MNRRSRHSTDQNSLIEQLLEPVAVEETNGIAMARSMRTAPKWVIIFMAVKILLGGLKE